MATIYVIVSEDGEREIYDRDTGKFLAWARRRDAVEAMENIGDDEYGPLHVESKEIQ